MITTEAWVLYRAPDAPRRPTPAELRREAYSFPDLEPDEALVEPLYGCWEGNMAHALARDPVDVCRQRDEEAVVLGNAGVVRVLRTGPAVTTLAAGDVCMVFCSGVRDEAGYPDRIYAYDAPGTVGILARQTKLREWQLLALPAGTEHSLEQWAAFSLRYVTAWANWKVAFGCWRLLDGEEPAPHVCGWGGGVAFAEVDLARLAGCRAALITSDPARAELIEQRGLAAIDRRAFSDLSFDATLYQADPGFRRRYQDAEERFLATVAAHTAGRGVSIFIDYVGAPVTRATLKALRRPGVLTTAGWKEGMQMSHVRALECMKWHLHVHTHYARPADAREAMRFAEERGWMPSLDGQVYAWDDVPQLAHDYTAQKLTSYFPLFRVNAA